MANVELLYPGQAQTKRLEVNEVLLYAGYELRHEDGQSAPFAHSEGTRKILYHLFLTVTLNVNI